MAGLTSGPLAPVPVTLVTVEERPITPALFGVGTVEARYTYRIGPTFAGRVSRVEVQVGERVKAGQLLGEMDPVDLDERVAAQDAALRRAESGVVAAHAQVRDAQARRDFASAQVQRYEQLLLARTASEDTVEAKRQEAQVARGRAGAGRWPTWSPPSRSWCGCAPSARHWCASAPICACWPRWMPLVVSRDAEPGSTVVAGQSVVEVIDPAQPLGRCPLRSTRRRRACAPVCAARIALRSQPLGDA